MFCSNLYYFGSLFESCAQTEVPVVQTQVTSDQQVEPGK